MTSFFMTSDSIKRMNMVDCVWSKKLSMWNRDVVFECIWNIKLRFVNPYNVSALDVSVACLLQLNDYVN